MFQISNVVYITSYKNCKQQEFIPKDWLKLFFFPPELNSFATDQPKSIVVSEGDPYTMECDPPSGFPKPAIFWIMQSSTGALRTINSSRITVDPEGNLHFSNITLGDASDETMYACSANSIFRNEFKLGNRVILNVSPTGSKSSISSSICSKYIFRWR